MICQCKEKKKAPLKGEIYRCFEVTTDEGVFEVEYYGKARGFEFINVNAELVHFQKRRFWFMPYCEFKIGSSTAMLSVKVWPWFEIKSLYFLVDGELAHKEGGTPAKSQMHNEPQLNGASAEPNQPTKS